jgi:hypothetical protein
MQRMNGYEVREYPEHIVAQTSIQGSPEESMNTGFSILAGYIFGGNTRKESISMTSPVFTQNSRVKKVSQNIAMTAPVIAMTEGDLQTISFGMPRAYANPDMLPIPNDSRVKIVIVEKKRFAVLSFSWYRSDERIKQMQNTLLSMLTRDGVTTKGGVAYAGYNPPWTPPWMNRNEVLVEITR